jgi:dTDP-4-dehydrorhamnose 3,5-epimerase
VDSFDSRDAGLPGCRLLRPKEFKDHRGRFVKTYHLPSFAELGLETTWEEDFWSESRKGVLRGLHYQAPPFDQAKLVTCLTGSILDVVVDLRRSSRSFLRHAHCLLDSARPEALYIPRGVGHGFAVLSESAIVFYKTSRPYCPEADRGILWNSCGIDWPIQNPILSTRDAGFPTLQMYMARPEFG